MNTTLNCTAWIPNGGLWGLPEETASAAGLAGLVVVFVWSSLAMTLCVESYLLPAADAIATRLNLGFDFGGVTVMAFAGALAELSILFVSMFASGAVDLGVGTAVGAAGFRFLALPALCALAATASYRLELSARIGRDVVALCISLVALAAALLWETTWLWRLPLLLVYPTYLGSIALTHGCTREARTTMYALENCKGSPSSTGATGADNVNASGSSTSTVERPPHYRPIDTKRRLLFPAVPSASVVLLNSTPARPIGGTRTPSPDHLRPEVDPSCSMQAIGQELTAPHERPLLHAPPSQLPVDPVDHSAISVAMSSKDETAAALVIAASAPDPVGTSTPLQMPSTLSVQPLTNIVASPVYMAMHSPTASRLPLRNNIVNAVQQQLSRADLSLGTLSAAHAVPGRPSPVVYESPRCTKLIESPHYESISDHNASSASSRSYDSVESEAVSPAADLRLRSPRKQAKKKRPEDHGTKPNRVAPSTRAGTARAQTLDNSRVDMIEREDTLENYDECFNDEGRLTAERRTVRDTAQAIAWHMLLPPHRPVHRWTAIKRILLELFVDEHSRFVVSRFLMKGPRISDLAGTGTSKSEGVTLLNTSAQPYDASSLYSLSLTDSLRFIFWLLLLPATLLFAFTIPNCTRPHWRSGRWISVAMVASTAWVTALSYVLTLALLAISTSLSIPPSIMGVLPGALAVSLPSISAALFLVRRGYAIDAAISSHLATGLVSLSLGIAPLWLINAALPSPAVVLSTGLYYTPLVLFTMTIFWGFSVALSDCLLKRSVAPVYIALFILFLLVVCLLETNQFALLMPPQC